MSVGGANDPSSVYGYSDEIVAGHATWSLTQPEWKPSASACWANSISPVRVAWRPRCGRWMPQSMARHSCPERHGRLGLHAQQSGSSVVRVPGTRPGRRARDAVGPCRSGGHSPERRASTGSMRAARIDGYRPATRPTRAPAGGAANGSHGSSSGVQSRAAETATTTMIPSARPDDAADEAHRRRLAQELAGDVAAAGAEGAAQPDLARALHHRHERDVGDADRADDEGDHAEQQEQAVDVGLHVVAGPRRRRRRGRAERLRGVRVERRGGLPGDQPRPRRARSR